MAHRGGRLARRSDRGGIERVVLGLDRPAVARGPEAGEALGDEAVDARLAGGREQRVGALGPQPVRLREGAVEIAREGQLCEAVAWWTIASGPASSTTRRTAARSRRSSATGSAPSARRSSALSADLEVPIT